MIYLTLFAEFFLIGLFTFGGGYAMIPLVQDTVLKYGWLSELEFLDLLGVCESTPGPIAINMATYVGSVQGGILGSLCATIGVVLPSFVIILLVSTILKKAIKNKYVLAFLDGVKPIVVGLITSAGLMLVIKVLGFVNLQSFNFDYKSLIIFSVLAILYVLVRYVFKKKFNTILFILISAIAGILFSIVLV